MTELADKLRLYRLEHNLRWRELAELLGVTVSALGSWCNKDDPRQPSERNQFQIDKLLNEELEADEDATPKQD